MRRRIFVQTLMAGSGSILIGGQESFGKVNNDLPIKITMIYNNIGIHSQLSSKWGLSLIVENNKEALLFDTGGDPEVLSNNMQKIEYNIQKKSKVVISHNHRDHVNGLDAIIDKSKITPDVYVPEYSLEDIQYNFRGANLIGVKEPLQINDFTWSTGQLTGEYDASDIHEQAIIILYNDTICVFTGCSHPGIVKIVQKTKSIFPDKRIKLVAGGFHMNQYSDQDVRQASEELRKLQVQQIAPSHCTGDKATQIFKDEWNENFVDFNLQQNQILV